MHLLKRDITSIVEVFVNHVYDKFCKINCGDLVIDCGAYIGEFTIYAAQMVGETGVVLAFEPNAESLALCKRNVMRNDVHNVKLFGMALGERETRAYLQVDDANLGATKVVSNPQGTSRSEVPVSTLDHFLPYLEGRQIKLLKLDVEGLASQILVGATTLLERRMIKNISGELHPGEEGLRNHLESHGFTCLEEGSYLYASLKSQISMDGGL